MDRDVLAPDAAAFDPNRDLIVTPPFASSGALVKVPLPPDGSASGHANIMRFVRNLHM